MSLVVVLALALGIGANAMMFGVVDRLLLRPPAYLRDASRLGRVFLDVLRLVVRRGAASVFPALRAFR